MRRQKILKMIKVEGGKTKSLTFSDLPLEICSLIFSLLTRNDLTRLARVCSLLLRISRPILYSSVILRNDDPNLQLQLRVVHEHAAGIQQLTLFTACVPAILHALSTTWINFTLLACFTGLRALTLIGSPFAVHEETTKFVATLRRTSPRLKFFTYLPHHPTYFPSPSFEISGLECITWYTYTASAPEPQAISMMSASVLTITSLSFPNCPGHSLFGGHSRNAHDTWDAFLSLRFPHLVSFSLGLMYAYPIHTRPKDTPTLLTDFLVEHPGLEHLSLGSSSDFEHLYEGISGSDELVGRGFLPALRSFESHPANLAIMVRQKVSSLQELTTLSILYYCGANNGPFEDLFLALEDYAGFPFVEHLKFQFSFGSLRDENMSAHLVLDWVRRLGAYYPTVLTFTGHLGPTISPWYLAQALHPYNILETVDLPSTTLTNPHGPVEAKDFIPLADACPALSQIGMKTPQSNGSTYIMCRNDEGALCEIIFTPRD